MKPVILTDIDGVLIQWQSGLPYFAAKHNLNVARTLELLYEDKFVSPADLFGCNDELAAKLLMKYNNSDFIKYLSPYQDAVQVINRLKDRFDFVAITALGDTDDALMNRMFNLNALFPGAFRDVMLVNYGESKTPHYMSAKIKYKDNLVCFVDDLAHNLEDCHAVISRLPLVHMLRGERSIAQCPVITTTNWYELEPVVLEMADKLTEHNSSQLSLL